MFGYPLTGALSSGGNFTSGLVSALRGLRDRAGELQITAPVQPGNSGGPLLDRSGLVVGVIRSKLDALGAVQATGDIPQNVNFAIALDVLAGFLERHKVAFREGPAASGSDTVSVAALAQEFTHRVECKPIKDQQASGPSAASAPPSGMPPGSKSAPSIPLSAGQVFKDCADCPEMVVVPAGSFTMGSPDGERVWDSDEGPQHRVTISRSFSVGKFEVTFEQWDACVAQGGCEGHRPGDRGWGRGAQPVINVSWDDAKAYVGWLSRKTGKTYRLLSEAEWEYSARGGTTTAWACGAQESCIGEIAWFDVNSGSRTQAVGSKRANAFGLHDMTGNVMEWVEDCEHGNYTGAPSDGGPWMAGGDCGQRVLRGGSWGSIPGTLRVAGRSRYATGFRIDHAGFRVARTN